MLHSTTNQWVVVRGHLSTERDRLTGRSNSNCCGLGLWDGFVRNCPPAGLTVIIIHQIMCFDNLHGGQRLCKPYFQSFKIFYSVFRHIYVILVSQYRISDAKHGHSSKIILSSSSLSFPIWQRSMKSRFAVT